MFTGINQKAKHLTITGVLGVLGAISLAACGADTPTPTPILSIPTPTSTIAATETPISTPTTEEATPTSTLEATANMSEPTATPEPTEAAPTNTPTAEIPTETPTTPRASTEVPTQEPTTLPTQTPTSAPTNTAATLPTEEPTQQPLDEQLEPTATIEISAPSSTTIDAVLREWAIDMSRSEVSAGTITFNVTNTGQFTHNLTVQSSSGSTLGATPTFSSSAGVQTFEVTLEPGTYTIICSLPGHASRGQKTTLVVK